MKLVLGAVLLAGGLLGAAVHRLEAGMVLGGAPTGGGNVPVNTAAPTLTTVTYVQDKFTQIASGQSATVVVTPTAAVTANHLLIAMVRGFNPTSNVTATTVSTSPTSACTHSPSTFVAQSGAGNPFSDVWYCVNGTTGTVNVTASFTTADGTTNNATTPSMLVAEFSGLSTTAPGAGVGAAQILTSNNSSMSLATTASVPAGSLVVSFNTPTAVNPTFSPPQLDFSTDPAHNFSYQITTAAGIVTHTYAFGTGANTAAVSIAGYLHP